MGLLRRYFDCDNILLDVLSTPNYGLAIPSPQWLKWETAIAEVVVNNMKKSKEFATQLISRKTSNVLYW